MKKVTEEELTQLKSLTQKINTDKMELAESALKAEAYKSKIESLKMEIFRSTDDLAKLQSALHDKYGEISINALTGEYVEK